MYCHDLGRTGYQPAETVLNPGNVGSLQQRWSFRPSQVGDPDLSETGAGFTASPTVDEGIIYVGHNDGYFYALDKWTGQEGVP
jgi:outer membrane protein assembly factor BamB